MPNIEHGDILPAINPSADRGIHTVEGFVTVVDEAARAAIVQVATDRGRAVYQSAGVTPGWYLADGAGVWQLIGAVPSARSVGTTAPLAGGGDLTANRTLTVATATTAAVGVVELATDGEVAADRVVQGNDARLANARTPTAHATSHENGGSDEISVAGLSGELADPQPPKTHAASHLPGGSDALTTAAPTATGVATASAVGAAASFARSDHAHQSNTAPTDVTKAAAAIGTSGEPARADHKHDLTTAAPATGIGGANSEGTATTAARSDHNHKLRTTTGPTDLDIAAIVDGEFLKRSGSQIVSAAVASVVTNVLDSFPIYVCPVDGTQLQVLWDDANLEGCLCYMPQDVTFNRIGFHSGVSWSGTFTERLCIFQDTTGAITTTMELLVNTTFTNAAAAANATFLVTVPEATIKAGWYVIALGRSSGAGSPFIDSLSGSPIGLHNENLSGMPSLFDGIVSAASPPATLDPTTASSLSGGDLCIIHKFKKV
jgi:hypothetical protein